MVRRAEWGAHGSKVDRAGAGTSAIALVETWKTDPRRFSPLKLIESDKVR